MSGRRSERRGRAGGADVVPVKVDEAAPTEFSFRSRKIALRRFGEEEFDLLVIGGGITGAATARDAASRGLKVALVERRDFAYGTSSRSSKLIHGGLRYLQNFELGLVFEALAERAFLLRSVPHRVRPLPFFLPIFSGDPKGMGIFSLGLWLYDLLALFRTPGFHRRLSKAELLKQIPGLRDSGLLGGFRYFDASMWDDVLAVETLRAAQSEGGAVANYVEAVAPIWSGERVTGFKVRDLESPSSKPIELRARQVISCVGPWTDELGERVNSGWHPRLNPSKGVHLIFDLKRIPVPGAVVMGSPADGRISFIIPRPDMGTGVVIVGTTDAPAPGDPDGAVVDSADVSYLLGLLGKYFPSLNVRASDIVSAYVGVRPLVTAAAEAPPPGEGQDRASSASLQKVSREHHIEAGPGGVVIVAGGKYTTHRRMAEEIVDFALKIWRRDSEAGTVSEVPGQVHGPRTDRPVNPEATAEAVAAAQAKALESKLPVPPELWTLYGAEAADVARIHLISNTGFAGDPEGFPCLAAQLRYAIRHGMVIHLEDFFLRRTALYLSRKDHGLPWAPALAAVWASERGLGAAEAEAELSRLREELARRSAWFQSLTVS